MNYQIQTLNAISPAIYTQLGEHYHVSDSAGQPDAILVRSASMHDMPLAPSVLSIARAGAGTNNIPIDACTQAGVCVFNTPGANANAVCEMVLAAMLLSCRDIVGGVEWARGLKGQGDGIEKAVEKGKKAFVGPELRGKTLGVIGLGAIGVLVANAAAALGMNVVGYDPLISVEHAWKLAQSVRHENSLDELFAACDFITVHVPMTDKTRGMIGRRALSLCKKGMRMMNYARGGLVDEAALLEALADGRVAAYVTDFPSDALLGAKGVICTPHLGASTPESEENCAVMAARQLQDYLVNGNIRNSVNLPNLEQEWSGISRLCLIHKNVPAMLTNIMSTLSNDGINVENMTNKSKKDYAYTIVDVNTRITDQVANELRAIPGVIRVRVLNH